MARDKVRCCVSAFIRFVRFERFPPCFFKKYVGVVSSPSEVTAFSKKIGENRNQNGKPWEKLAQTKKSLASCHLILFFFFEVRKSGWTYECF